MSRAQYEPGDRVVHVHPFFSKDRGRVGTYVRNETPTKRYPIICRVLWDGDETASYVLTSEIGHAP